MAAVNIIFILLSHFIPFLLFVLVLVLPLCSAIISYYCKKVYFPIYLIVVSSICLLIDPGDAIFYVIPSLITGFLFGLGIEKKIPPLFVIAIITAIQFGMSMAFIPLIKLITNRDIVFDMASIFRLQDYEYLEYVKFAFIFFVSFAQIMLTYIVLHSELQKFGMSFNESGKKSYLYDICSIASSLLVILFGFVYPPITYIFTLLAFYFAIGRMIYLDYSKYKVYLIELGVIVIGTIFFVALLYPRINNPLGLALVTIAPFLTSCACLLNNCLLSKRNKDTINS